MLVRWSILHAAVMVVTTPVAAALGRPAISVIPGTASLLGLTVLHRKQWTPGGSFGAANFTTLIRLAGVGAMVAVAGYVSPYVITLLGFLLLVSDGVDGWLARRQDQASTFGEYFDKETDAFLLLTVCLLIASRNLVGPWIVTGGLYRYLFVLAGRSLKGRRLVEGKSNRGRIIYIVTTGLLLLVFLPLPALHLPLAIIALILLTYSFAGEFWQVISAG